MVCKNCGSTSLTLVEESIYVCQHCMTRNQIELEIPQEQTKIPESIEEKIAIDFDLIAKAIVRIKTPQGTGTGFFINDEGYVITNAHVVEDFDILQGFIGSSPLISEFEYIADGQILGYDLAILQLVSQQPYEYLSLSERIPRVGDDIIVIGNPKNLGISVNKGSVSRLNQNALQLDVSVNPGNSGSPVLDASGHVVGVISYTMDELKGLSFAMDLQSLQIFLDHVFNSLDENDDALEINDSEYEEPIELDEENETDELEDETEELNENEEEAEDLIELDVENSADELEDEFAELNENEEELEDLIELDEEYEFDEFLEELNEDEEELEDEEFEDLIELDDELVETDEESEEEDNKKSMEGNE